MFKHEISRQRLPPLSIDHCNVLQALVSHLQEFKSHKEKLFTKEGKTSERKMLLKAFDDGIAPNTKVLKKLSSKSICHVIRQMIETEHAPLIPYIACEELFKLNQDKLILDQFQGIIQSIPNFHTTLLSSLLELMNKISFKSQNAENSIIQNLGIYLIRPNESTEELKDLFEKRQYIARVLISSYKTISFEPKSYQEKSNDIKTLPLRLSCIPWTKETIAKLTPLLHYLINTPGDKRDLFQNLQTPGQINKLLNDIHEGKAIGLNDYSLLEIAAVLKRVLQPLEALVNVSAFQLSNKAEDNLDMFIIAVQNLSVYEKNFVRLLFKLFDQIIKQGATVDFLCSAMSNAIFDQIKHILTIDVNEQRQLKQAACLMLCQAKQIVHKISPQPSCFTIVTVVWLCLKLCKRLKRISTALAPPHEEISECTEFISEEKITANDPIPAFHTAPEFNDLICSRLPILQKLFMAFCNHEGTKRIHDIQLVQMLETMEIIPVLTTSEIVAQLSHSIQANRRNINGNRGHSPLRSGLTFEGFVELILILGVKVLSQPEFDAFYPSEFNKMLVVLDIWGFGNDKI
ncbi:hypothetical protein THRCLA_10681, partial [Thraustotheca clavata]